MSVRAYSVGLSVCLAQRGAPGLERSFGGTQRSRHRAESGGCEQERACGDACRSLVGAGGNGWEGFLCIELR